MTCSLCSRWRRHHNPGPVVPTTGECSLHLPRWLTNSEGPDYTQQETKQDDTCSFLDLVEMEGDMEAIYGWGGQG